MVFRTRPVVAARTLTVPRRKPSSEASKGSYPLNAHPSLNMLKTPNDKHRIISIACPNHAIIGLGTNLSFDSEAGASQKHWLKPCSVVHALYAQPLPVPTSPNDTPRVSTISRISHAVVEAHDSVAASMCSTRTLYVASVTWQAVISTTDTTGSLEEATPAWPSMHPASAPGVVSRKLHRRQAGRATGCYLRAWKWASGGRLAVMVRSVMGAG